MSKLDKKKFLEDHGYIVITIWEHEWEKVKKTIKANKDIGLYVKLPKQFR